jgi:hypothetical protein
MTTEAHVTTPKLGPSRNPWDENKFATPTQKASKESRDDCSTAAPSPYLDFESPWPSPGMERRYQPYLRQLPAIPSCDFSLFASVRDELIEESDKEATAFGTMLSAAVVSIHEAKTKDFMSSPVTPVQGTSLLNGSKPPLLGPSSQPPLMRALSQANHTTRLKEVEAVLSENPEAALFPFWEHGCEPPLCFAVRVGCDAQVVELILKHGADVKAPDLLGQTPLSILHSQLNRWNAIKDLPFFDTFGSTKDRSEQLELIEAALLRAGGELPAPSSKAAVASDPLFAEFEHVFAQFQSGPPPLLAAPSLVQLPIEQHWPLW